MDWILIKQQGYCDNLPMWLRAFECYSNWVIRGDYNTLLYSYPAILHPCSPVQYKQLALDTIKLSWLVDFTETMHLLEILLNNSNKYSDLYVKSSAIQWCQDKQHSACLCRRQNLLCGGSFTLFQLQAFDFNYLLHDCILTTSDPFKSGLSGCMKYRQDSCSYDNITGHVITYRKLDDISGIYNLTNSHEKAMEWTEILLMSSNRALSHCDERNLFIKQVGCFQQYISVINLNEVNIGNYFTNYICSFIHIYDMCWETYDDSCPKESAEGFDGLGKYLRSMCNLFTVTTGDSFCPVFSFFHHHSLKTLSTYYFIYKFRENYILFQSIATNLTFGKHNVSKNYLQSSIEGERAFLASSITLEQKFKTNFTDQYSYMVNPEICSSSSIAAFHEYAAAYDQYFYDQFVAVAISTYDYMAKYIS